MGVKTVNINGKEMEYLHFGNKVGEKIVILPGRALKSVMGSIILVNSRSLTGQQSESLGTVL